MPKIVDIPRNLRPYGFHGVILTENGTNAKGDCPFCGREGKFSVKVETGEARCWGCTVNPEAPKGGVNPRTFLQRLWEVAKELTTDQDFAELQAARPGIRKVDTLRAWGCAKGTTGEWLVPGWDAGLRLCQLYRWGTDRILRATPKAEGILGAGLFMREWNKDRPGVLICEGPWDAMALEDALGMCRKDEDGTLRPTSSVGQSMLGEWNVVAIPGCGTVGDPLRPLLPLFAGKRVVLCFDSDHPKGRPGAMTSAGYEAVKRAAAMIGENVSWLRWGTEGFDPLRPSGFDVRDRLKEAF